MKKTGKNVRSFYTVFRMFLFNEFPREVAFPSRKVVFSKEEWLREVNCNNGRKRVFTSLYNSQTNGESSIHIDKIWFDLDSENSLDNVKKMHSYCLEKDLRHVTVFSGGGFHFYVFTSNGMNLNSPSIALFNSQQFLCKEMELSIGDPHKSAVDFHIIGDVRRIVTVPNTYNLRRGKYCIPVSKDDLDKGLEHIEDLADSQNFNYFVYGKKLFNVKEFDRDMKEFHKKLEVEFDVDLTEIDPEFEFFQRLPLCIKVWLREKHVGWRRRGWIIMFLRNFGIWRRQINKPLPATYNEVLKIFQKYLGEKEFKHCTSTKDGYQIRYLYFENTKNQWPNCETIKSLGQCPIDGICSEVKSYRVVE